jgi:site-specific DNA-methyltransferase (adenine-specific)
MKPYFNEDGITLYHGDSREILPQLPVGDCVIADPPYGQTSLKWDVWPKGWIEGVRADSLWIFGTMRMFLLHAPEIFSAGFAMSQDLVWEKHNGSSSAADRFRRVHEQMIHFYRGPWDKIHKVVPTTPDATARTVRSKKRPPQWGGIGESSYESQDGGPRLMRSVIYERSCHGFAVNETQKPLGIIRPLIEYSCPANGLVIDPFSGSGSTLVAAREMGRRAIGMEMRESQCAEAAKRLSHKILAFGE